MAQINEFLGRPHDEIIRVELKERTRKKIVLDCSMVGACVGGYYALLHAGLLGSLPVEPVIPLYILLVFAGIVSPLGIIRARRVWGADVKERLGQLKSTLDPFRCPADERAYYQEVHGFDPMSGWDADQGRFFYESWFPLLADPQLFVVGVTVGARVEQVPGQAPSNRIIFRNNNGLEGEVYCTHTVVMTSSAGDALNLANDSILEGSPVPEDLKLLAGNGGPAQLPPWGHFAALKSYVAGIAGEGILSMLHAASRVEQAGDTPLPFGFNVAMRQQVIGALRNVAPAATDAIVIDFFLRLVDEAPLEWLIPRVHELEVRYQFARAFFSRGEFMRALVAQVPPKIIATLFRGFRATDLINHPPVQARDCISSPPAQYFECLKILLTAVPWAAICSMQDLLSWDSAGQNSPPPGSHLVEVSGAILFRDGPNHIQTMELISVPQSAWSAKVDPRSARCAVLFHFTQTYFRLGKIVPGLPVRQVTLGARESLDIESPVYPVTKGRLSVSDPWVKDVRGTGSVKITRRGCRVKNENKSRPLVVSFFSPKEECVFVHALANISVLVWDGNVSRELSLDSVMRGLREFLNLGRRDAGQVLLDVVGIIDKHTRTITDYLHRPLRGLGDPFAIMNCFARPYAELLGIPLTLGDLALGLDRPEIRGCVMSAKLIQFDSPLPG